MGPVAADTVTPGTRPRREGPVVATMVSVTRPGSVSASKERWQDLPGQILGFRQLSVSLILQKKRMWYVQIPASVSPRQAYRSLRFNGKFCLCGVCHGCSQKKTDTVT
jgi:hypothetical protein